MERIKLAFLVILVLSGLSSCRKESAADQASVDVFVKTIIKDGIQYYGASHFVVGTDAMKSVAVSSPDGVTDSLFSYDSSNLYYHLDPSINFGTYYTTPPTSGTYTYSIKFNDGLVKSFTNVLATTHLVPPTIESLVKSTDGTTVNLKWDAVPGAEAYAVKVTKGGIQAYSVPSYIDPSILEYDLPITSLSTYAPGTFTFEIDAILFESTTSASYQSIGASTANIDL